MRIKQLFTDSLSISLSNHPIRMRTYTKYLSGEGKYEDSWWNHPHHYLNKTYLEDRFVGGGIKLGVFEPVVATTFNSKYPTMAAGTTGRHGTEEDLPRNSEGASFYLLNIFPLPSGPISFSRKTERLKSLVLYPAMKTEMCFTAIRKLASASTPHSALVLIGLRNFT